MEKPSIEKQRDKIVQTIREYIQESREAKQEWLDKTDKVWDVIHGRIDWSHKKEHNAKIHLNIVGLAQDRLKAQLKQGLMNFEEWLIVEAVPGFESDLLSPGEAKRLVNLFTEDSDLKATISDNIGIAAVENLLATKIRTEMCEIKGPGGKTKKKYKTKLIPLNLRSFFPDPTMDDLYEIHESEIDKFRLLKMADEKPTKLKPYKLDVVKALSPSLREEMSQDSATKGNDYTATRKGRRCPIVIHEFWGTILDDNGEILEFSPEEGDPFLLENVLITVANQEVLLHDPRPNPRFNQKSPFTKCQLMRSNENMFGRSLLMPGADLNRAQDELISLMTDGAVAGSYNINFLRVDALAKPEQVSGGIEPGMTLLVNRSLGAGEKPMETVTTGKVDPYAFQVYGELGRSGTQNMGTNEMNLTGSMSSKQVRATELVQSQNTVQGLFEAIASDIEDLYLEQLILNIYHECLQYAAKLDDEDLLYVFFGNEERAAQFQQLTPKQIFEELANNFRFKGKGIRGINASAKVGQMLINLISMAVQNPMVGDQLEREGYSIPKILGRVIQGMGIDVEEFKSLEVAEFSKMRQLIREQALMQQEMAQGQPQEAQGGQAGPMDMAEGAEGQGGFMGEMGG